MNRSDRRKLDRKLKKNVDTIQKLTPAQTKIVAIAAKEQGKAIADDFIEKFESIIDRSMSAALVNYDIDLEDIEKIQEDMSNLMIEDSEKSKELEKENIDIMKIEKEAQEAIEKILESGASKKQAIGELVYKFPKLSKSMILNAYAKIRQEKGSIENRVPREEVYKYFDSHSITLNGPAMVKSAIKEFGFTESTAQTYYYKWKKEYMTREAKECVVKDCCKEDEEKIIEATDANNATTENHIAEESKMVSAPMLKGTEELKEIREDKSIGNKLEVLSMTVKGENGTYKACEKGVELQNQGLIMFFKDVEQLENFTKEYKQVFELVK